MAFDMVPERTVLDYISFQEQSMDRVHGQILDGKPFRGKINLDLDLLSNNQFSIR